MNDDSTFKVETLKVPEVRKTEKESLIFEVKLLIKFIYARDNTEVSYVLDRDTGKKKRIKRLEALKLIEEGKAEIVNFKDE